MTIVPTKNARLCPNARGSCSRNGCWVNSAPKLLSPTNTPRVVPCQVKKA